MAIDDSRRIAICEQPDPIRVTGIDFIKVEYGFDEDDTPRLQLRVFFIIDPNAVDDPVVQPGDTMPFDYAGQDLPDDRVRVESVDDGSDVLDVRVLSAFFEINEYNGVERQTLVVVVDRAGDFSNYRVVIGARDHGGSRDGEPWVDRFFNGVEFNFQQLCRSDFDCKVEEECPEEQNLVEYRPDYEARDYHSIRQSLLDFAAERYPTWGDPIAADVGVMLAEVMAAVGDEFSYMQDRIARETHFGTATQRRSVRKHAALVDYHTQEGRAATTMLAFKLKPAESLLLESGARAISNPEDGGRVAFEVYDERGLTPKRHLEKDEVDEFSTWDFDAEWNEMDAYCVDPADACLPVGSTEIYIDKVIPPSEIWELRDVVLLSAPEDPQLPRKAHHVKVSRVELFEDPLNGETVTRVFWDEAYATVEELDLTTTVMLGNVAPAIAGESRSREFIIGDGIPEYPEITPAVARKGALNELTGERPSVYMYSLPGTEECGLGWLGTFGHTRPRPEVRVEELFLDAVTDPMNPEYKPYSPPRFWQFVTSTLDATVAQDAFSLDDGTWREAVRYVHNGETFIHQDYASSKGHTVRFGDGDFGRLPARGTVFRVSYRIGPGTNANLPFNSVRELDPTSMDSNDFEKIESVTNPFDINSGLDPEPVEHFRRFAPEAYQVVNHRAVTDDDYRVHAEMEPCVQSAGSLGRWTGSWMSQVITADERGSNELQDDCSAKILERLDCVRQAGRQIIVREPVYMNLDLEVSYCPAPGSYGGQVTPRLLKAAKKYFTPDRFTFGTPFRRPTFEAVLQDVPGLGGITGMWYRIRGKTDWIWMGGLDDPYLILVPEDRILRVGNDLRRPEFGRVRFVEHDDAVLPRTVRGGQRAV